MVSMNYQIIILAAGNGTRMQSDLPKVMHEIAGKPMIERALLNAQEVTDDIIIVYSKQLKKYLTPYKDICKFALQDQQLGTAHATHAAIDLIDDNKMTAILYGDNPLITSEIIRDLLEHLVYTDSAVNTLCFERNNPGQYGRIITDDSGNFLKIIEFKDASEQEKMVQLCNSGVMAFKAGVLRKYLPYSVSRENIAGSDINEKKELYLTEIIKICKDHGEKVSYLLSHDHNAVIGVNTKQELAIANNIIGSAKVL